MIHIASIQREIKLPTVTRFCIVKLEVGGIPFSAYAKTTVICDGNHTTGNFMEERWNNIILYIASNKVVKPQLNCYSEIFIYIKKRGRYCVAIP